MSLRAIALTTVAVWAAAIGLAAIPATALAVSSSGVSAGPLHWDTSNPATRTYYIPTVSPGGSFRDQMRVQNPNNDSVDLFVNAVDGITAIPTGAVYANRTDPLRKYGAWVTTDVAQLTLAAHQETLVGFTVHVPTDATPGDHLAGVAFENAHPTPGSGPISITSAVRTVVGILTKVPGPASFHLTILGASIQPLSNANLSSVVVTLTDDGLLLGHPFLTVALTGPKGYAKTVSRRFDTVLPLDTIALPFPWPDNLVPGEYHVTVNATAREMTGIVSYSGITELSGALKGVPAPGSAQPVDPKPSTSGVSLPSWVVAMMIGTGVLVAGVAVLGATLFRVLRRQRFKRVASGAERATPLP